MYVTSPIKLSLCSIYSPNHVCLCLAIVFATYYQSVAVKAAPVTPEVGTISYRVQCRVQRNNHDIILYFKSFVVHFVELVLVLVVLLYA